MVSSFTVQTLLVFLIGKDCDEELNVAMASHRGTNNLLEDKKLMAGLKSWCVVLVQSQVNVRSPGKYVSLSTWKKKPCSFPPGTDPNHSKPLLYLFTEAEQIISYSKPIFFYLYAFTNFRHKVISNCVQRNLYWKKFHFFEPRVVVSKSFCQNTGNKPTSKLPQSWNDSFQNENPLFKKKLKSPNH